MTAGTSFTFVDLFAGIGGFHAAGAALGGTCVYASEIDPDAQYVYKRNWGLAPKGDLRLATEGAMEVPEHDVLFAGFPCQPFSKSGRQKGIDEARGTLFWNILRVIEARRPKLVVLENVRNLAGPRHASTLATIVRKLQELGYAVNDSPLIVSPHQLHPDLGGAPQVRDRVYILAVRSEGEQEVEINNQAIREAMHQGRTPWSKFDWDVREHLPVENVLSAQQAISTRLTVDETEILNCWDDFVQTVLTSAGPLASVGFPLWLDFWGLDKGSVQYQISPDWKRKIIDRNFSFYGQNSSAINAWLDRNPAIRRVPPSFRKLEWQAGGTPSIWNAAVQFRPSGVRAKKMDYLPALVAMNQRSILGPLRRRVTVREAARLQGFPESFDFGAQGEAQSFKQLGNAVNVGVVTQVTISLLSTHASLFRPGPLSLDALPALETVLIGTQGVVHDAPLLARHPQVQPV